MRYFLLLFYFIVSNFSSYSQTETEYLDQNFGRLSGKDGAIYIRNTQYEDKKQHSKIVQTSFATGEKLSEFRSAKTEKGNFLYEGPYQKWYKNGQLFYTTQYQRGRKEGESLTYYASGKLKRKETFVMDKLEKGECFKEDGTPLEYFPHEEKAEFPGGSAMMSKYLAQNTKYPVDAMRNGKQGSVKVRFTVDEFGKINNIEVVEGIYPALDAEAVRVVQSMPDFKPAKEEGESKSFVYNLPISFLMTSSAPSKSEDFRSPSDKNGQKTYRRF